MTTFPLNRADTLMDVSAIGNAIVDIIARVEDDFITSEGMIKGTMTLIEAGRAEALYDKLGQTVECSGGSAANTLAALASLGSRTAFMGRVHADNFGEIYRHDLRAAGVKYNVPAAEVGLPTARCYVCVTPDGERTMNTFIGACSEFSESDVDEKLIADSAILYLEGYQWYQPEAKEAIRMSIAAAQSAKRSIAFTLSDLFCVEANYAEFLALIEGPVDIVFANEVEAKAISKQDDLAAAADFLASRVKLAVVTCGAHGALIRCGTEKLVVPAQRVPHVVDQTGAGDLFAAGFLHGLVEGRELTEAAKLGHVCAAEIIAQLGARSAKPLARLVA